MNWLALIDGQAIADAGGAGNPSIADITYDSRTAGPGMVYVAVPGFAADGDRFIDDAIARGAVAIVSANAHHGRAVPWIRVDNPRKSLGQLAQRLWNIRWDTMVTVGITGTNGKTTVAHLYHHLFSSIYGAKLSWMFGTVAYKMGEAHQPATNTTPQSCDIFRFIGMAQPQPRALIMEVSSHALALDRVEGFFYDVAIFTNLSQDHLDFHKNMEDYFQAKKRLFTHHLKRDGIAVVNIDDPWGQRLMKELTSVRAISFGKSPEAQVRICDYNCSWNSTEIELNEQGGRMKIQSSLSGIFNVYNLVALWAGARALGKDPDEIRGIVDKAPRVPGRMQRVSVPGDFTLVVDYAHTPDALEKVLDAARILTKGKLVCVFGCGGDRDRAKRPLMAEAVARRCDEAVVTSDNPRSEEPMSIIGEILEGMPLDFPHRIIADRREAIREAMKIARPGDCVVVAGKGHETYQEIKGVRHHFDDIEVINEIGAEKKELAVHG